MKTVAKAIRYASEQDFETVEQYQKLKEIGCDLGQGYYIAKPLFDIDFKRFLLNKV